MGMGIHTLSMAASSIPRVRWAIRSFTQARARELLGKALEMEDATNIRRLLNVALHDAGVGALARPGRSS